MQGRVVLVTGGARGIGRGIVEAFLHAGAKVVAADLGSTDREWVYDLASSEDLERTVAEQSALGEVHAAELDVTVKASCEAVVAKTVDMCGGLDVLVNNAGVVHSGTIAQFSEVDWDRVFEVNTKGVFLMTQAALPELRKSTQGAIINTASIAGKKGYARMAAYCGSKFAVIGITQSMAAELARDGITVNAICPGMVGTAMWLEHLLPSNAIDVDEKNAEFRAAMERTIPLGRPQTAQDMGNAVVYLASAPNVTGISLNVAGGYEMN